MNNSPIRMSAIADAGSCLALFGLRTYRSGILTEFLLETTVGVEIDL
jgi:hypothetical protein